ncbi:MAG: polymer-forming cytoskeletal protein [Anaerolineales bacterium]
MFKKKEESPQRIEASSPQERVTSVLGPDMTWKGELSGEGGVRVEGAFEGSMNIDGLVVVDRKGRVTSESIQARSVIIAGAVRSDIKAERVEIRGTGRVWGNVITKSFSTEEGAYLRGKIEMEEEGGEKGAAGEESGEEKEEG